MSQSPHSSRRLGPALSAVLAACLALGAIAVPQAAPAAAAAAAAETSPIDPCDTYFENGFPNGVGDGKWSTPSNWSTGQVPTASDVACVIEEVATVDTLAAARQLHGSGTVLLASGELHLSQTSNILTVEVRDGVLRVDEMLAPYSFTQQGGEVTGAGTIDIAGSFAWSGGTQSDPNGLTTVAAEGKAVVIPIVPLTWSGRQLQVDGKTSVVGPGDVHFGDSGVYLADAAFEGGHIGLEGSHVTIANGSVETSLFLPTGANVAGTWTLQPESALGVSGGTISGTVNVDSDAGVFVRATEPGAPATTVLPTGAILGIGGITVESDATLDVDGIVFVDWLENGGTVLLDASAVIDQVINAGVLQIGPDVELTVADMTIESGDVTLTESSTLTTGATPIKLTGGTLALSGLIHGSVEQSGGVLAPGAAGGTAIRGTYNQSGGTLSVSIGENRAVPLFVEFDAVVGGVLEVNAANPIHVTQPLLVAGTMSGTFTEFSNQETICPELAYEADQVILESAFCPVVPPIVATEGNGLAVFSVSIDAPLLDPYEFNYETVDGNALAGSDYVASSGTAAIPPGSTSVGVEIEILDDDVVENDEDFGLVIEGPTDSAVAITAATLVDDDDRVGYDNYFMVDDIGSMGSGLVPDGINANGVVGSGSWNADEGFSWVWSFAEQRRIEISGFENEPVFDVNEQGQILSIGAIRERGGVITPLAAVPGVASYAAAALNDAGMVAGVGYPTSETAVLVRWANGSPVVLDAPTASTYLVQEINESGTIVGSVFFEGAAAYEAFRYDDTGFHILPKPQGASGAWAEGINDNGVTVGSSNGHAIMWAADGSITDLGVGAAFDINAEGVVVGHARDDSQDPARYEAALWVHGNQFELGDYVPDGTGWSFDTAMEINDQGAIAGNGWYGNSERTFVLRPYDCYICVTTRFDEPDVDAPTTYIPVDGATTDGNPVRLEAELTNSSNSQVSLEVWVIDTLTEEALHDEPFELSLAPGGGRSTVAVDIDTTGMAWSNGSPAEPRRFEILVREADQGIDVANETVALTVDPRPMVLVHGLWSDKFTWADYQAFAQNAHSRWKAYAVDTMDTSSALPKTIAQNAAEVDAFIDQLRSSQNIWSVDLVGHSMGGLISRHYIQELMPTYQIPGVTGDVPAVDRLVMLGTPNGGSPCAWVAPLPATVELRPEVVAAFNFRITDRRGVDFSVASGLHVPFTCATSLPGDDVVPLVSAGQGMQDVVRFDGMAHTSMTGSHDLFTQFVLPRLNGTSIAPSTVSRTMSLAATDDALDDAADEVAVNAADGESMPLQPDTQALYVDTIAVLPGSTERIGITVPDDATHVSLTVAADGVVAAQLVDPAGVVRASFAAEPSEFPSFRTLTAEASSGRWIVRVINTAEELQEVSLGVAAVATPLVLEAHATQVHWSGRVQLNAELLRAAADRPTTLVGELRDSTGRKQSVVLFDDGLNGDGSAGDGRYGLVVRGLPAGPAMLRVQMIEPGFMRAATGGLVVAIPNVPPPNTAPTADPLHVEVGRDTPQRFTLTGTDAENDDLSITAVGAPTHGVLSGIAPRIVYTPFAGYRGPDSFTFVVGDGQATSAPATVTIDVGASPVEIRYDGPYPASGGQGEQVVLRARVTDATAAGVAGVPVTFRLGDHERTETTSTTGYTGVDIVLDAAPGEYELRITSEATADYRAGATVQRFVVTPNGAPTVGLGSIISDEAGYLSRVVFGTTDPENDIVAAEWDMNDDGVVDASTGAPETFGANEVFVDHVYPAAYSGLVRVTVVDSAGNRASSTLSVDIKPYQPLGSLSRLTADGGEVRALGMDDSARWVLYEGDVPGSANPVRHQLMVLDRETAQTQLVSIGVDGVPVDAEIGTISQNGRIVAFMSGGGTAVAQVFVRDLDADTTTAVSVDEDGTFGNDTSIPLALSEDGDRLLFSTRASNLGSLPCAGCFTNRVWDRSTGEIELVSIDPAGSTVQASGTFGDISADGSRVAMVLTIDGASRIVVRDLQTATSVLASVNIDGEPSTGGAPHLNHDGSVLVFSTSADDIFPGDTNGFSDVVVRDLAAGHTRSVSSMIAPADGASISADVSGDGTRVVFSSNADVRTGERTLISHVYVADLLTDTVSLISREARSATLATDNSRVGSGGGWISCDGRYAMFLSDAANLVPGDVQTGTDAFLEDTGVSRPCEPAGNVAPVAESVSVTTDEDAPVAVDFSASDADGDELTFEIIDGPAHGTVTGDAPALVYTPVGDWHGTDGFTFRVSDGTVWSEPAMVAIAVSPVNDAPVVQLAEPATIAEGTDGEFAATATDVDGDPLTYSWATDHGTIIGTTATALLSDVDGPATAQVTVTVSDGIAPTAASRAVTILNVDPTVQIQSPSPGTKVVTSKSVQLDTTTADAAGAADPVTCVVTWGDGTSTTSCDGSHAYTATGTFTITVTAHDGDGGTASATTSVVVEDPASAECRFAGFFAPVDNAPTVNIVKAGANIPVKFSYCTDGRLAVFANGSPTSSVHSCGGSSTDVLEETASPGASALTFDPTTLRYHYNWKSERGWAGQCRTLTLRLTDGTIVSAEFKFR